MILFWVVSTELQVLMTEIYRIVSQKQIQDGSSGDAHTPSNNVQTITVAPTSSAGEPKKSCCNWCGPRTLAPSFEPNFSWTVRQLNCAVNAVFLSYDRMLLATLCSLSTVNAVVCVLLWLGMISKNWYFGCNCATHFWGPFPHQISQ